MIVQAEISQSMLKWSNDQQREEFAEQILNFINPKFESEEEYNGSVFVLLEFAKTCELTAREMLLALEMAADGKLFDGEHRVKVFREIDRLKLGEIKGAYINYKRADRQYEIGRDKIRKALQPEYQPTPEQVCQIRSRNWESLKAAASENRHCPHAFMFYEGLVKRGHLSRFVNNQKAQEKLLGKKMREIVFREVHRPIIFSKREAQELMKKIKVGEPLPIHSLAVIEVKNDLVYNFIQKQIKRKINNKF